MTPKSRWGTPWGLVFGAYMGAFGTIFVKIFNLFCTSILDHLCARFFEILETLLD